MRARSSRVESSCESERIEPRRARMRSQPLTAVSTRSHGPIVPHNAHCLILIEELTTRVGKPSEAGRQRLLESGRGSIADSIADSTVNPPNRLDSVAV